MSEIKIKIKSKKAKFLSVENIGYGLGVCWDERKPRQKFCRLPRSSSDITKAFYGITCLEIDLDKPIEESESKYVKRTGAIWVTVEDEVLRGSDVFCRHAGDEHNLGFFRSDRDHGTASKVPYAEYGSDGCANGLALVVLKKALVR